MSEAKNNYYIWFRKIVSTCIALFFVLSFISNLFAYVSVFEGFRKYLFFLILLVLVLASVYFFKESVRRILSFVIGRLASISLERLFVILLLSSVLLKTFYYAFFFFDSTAFGEDITIYAQIADSIAENGLNSVERQIYYLVGLGLHLSVFKRLSIPYHLGVYLVFLITTLMNFLVFSRYIGKEKSFILIELYLLMPSTSMLTFCVTHELFVYFYFSMNLFLLNLFLQAADAKKAVLFAVLATVFVSLNQTLSPMGKIWFILLALIILLTDIGIGKKSLLVLVLVSSFLCSDLMTTKLEGNRMSQYNNYEQLLIGSDLESMGRHTDGKGKRSAEQYWEARGQYLTPENYVEGQRGALIEQYRYLFTHPLKLFELLANKFFVAWSGDFYSVEYAHNMHSISDLTNIIMLTAGALIWLFVITAGIVFYVKEEKPIAIYNYEIILLGVMAVLLITEIMNKYSSYMTLFIYFIAFSRVRLSDPLQDRKG